MANYVENIIGDFDYLQNTTINAMVNDASPSNHALLICIRNRMSKYSSQLHDYFMRKTGLGLNNIMDTLYCDIGTTRQN